MFLGLRTVIYPAPDLAASRDWYAGVLGFEPYYDEPYFVGFNVGGYELGLDPEGDVAIGAETFWGVPDIEVAVARLLAAGATPHSDVREVGDGIKVASVLEPGGALLGVIENPHFVVTPPTSPGAGPGR